MTAFRVEARSNPLASPDDAADLRTPQATIELLFASARRSDWRQAARTLDLRTMPDATPERAARLARQLVHVLRQELWIDWSLLPDRPDGLRTGSVVGTSGPMAGEPRRSISLGEIERRERRVPIRVHRLLPESGEPVWLIAAQSVGNIEALYAEHGPSPIADRLPAWATERGWLEVPTWQWIALAGVLATAPLVALLAAGTILPLVARRVPGRVRPLVRQLRWPVGVAAALATAWAVIEGLLALPASVGDVVSGTVTVGLIAAVGWMLIRGIHYAIEHVAKRALRDHTEEDSTSRRRLLTQLTVVRHVVAIGLVLLTIAVVLLEFGLFRTIGLLLLTSAGAAAVVVGIAGHAVLGNLVAGLQIAIVRPFRVGDTVNVEGNWGRIEDVTYTYVIVNTWDARRLVLPIQYFIREPFENWARTDRFLMKPIFLRVDFRADVERIRQTFLELIREDEHWAGDRDEPTVLVTDAGDETMTIRLTAGGASPSDAWSLECRTRERLLAWLRGVEGGRWLPRRRAEVGALGAGEDRPGDGAAPGPQADGARPGTNGRAGGSGGDERRRSADEPSPRQAASASIDD